MVAPNPVMVEVSRGGMVESLHCGAAAVVDASTRVIAAWGDIDRLVYARSAIKPLQTLALIESGAAERFDLGDDEIALACASHNGEPKHVDTVTRWLERVGLGAQDLECGPQLPLSDDATAELLRAGGVASAIHNNCSGKHAGFLTTARHLGEPTRGYSRADHPVQKRLRRMLEDMSGVSLAHAPAGVDGCGIPVLGLSLRATASAMARLACPASLAGARAAAAERVLRAMIAAPFMVSGSGRFCTQVMCHTGTAAVVKVGAEGVFTAALPGKGLGVALKIDDGARRAAEVAIGALLAYLGVLSDSARAALATHLTPCIRNRRGAVVGGLSAAPGWPA
ncbi:MAG: asparaginase [Gammaproteobacteria bacterium]|nr:MAG: asparaginase [Gammaproteobacteria bacterium]